MTWPLTKEMMRVIESGGEIHEKIKNELERILIDWEVNITPAIYKDPSEKFQYVARFYQKALAIETSGRLVSAKIFSLMHPRAFRSENDEVRIKEIQRTMDEKKWSPFDGKVSLNPKTMASYIMSPETQKGSFKILDQALFGLFERVTSKVTMLKSAEFKKLKEEKPEEFEAFFKHAFDVKYRIFSQNIGQSKAADLVVRMGHVTYNQKTDMNRSMSKALMQCQKKHLKGRTEEILNEFNSHLDQKYLKLVNHDDNKGKITLYNKFMGFQNNSRDKEIGEFLAMIHDMFPWALNFTGMFDGQMARDLIEELEEAKKESNFSKADKKRIVYKHIIDTVSINSGLTKKATQFLDVCFNTKDYAGVDHLRYLAETFSQDQDRQDLFIDIAHNLSEDIAQKAADFKINRLEGTVISEDAIEQFKRLRQQKDILHAIGVEVDIRLPTHLSELDDFTTNKNLSDMFKTALSNQDKTILYGHDIFKNVVVPLMEGKHTALNTKEVFNIVYSDGINVCSFVKAMLNSERQRDLKGQGIHTDISQHMKDIKDIPLPVIPNLNGSYGFEIHGDNITIDFFSTLEQFNRSFTWKTKEGRSFDDVEKINYSAGDLGKLSPLIGQRILSQGTSCMLSDMGSYKRPFMVHKNTSYGPRPLAYGEIDVAELTKETPEFVPSMICVDDMDSSVADVVRTIRKLKRTTAPRVKMDDLIRERQKHAKLIAETIGNTPLIKPADENMNPREWMYKRNMFPILPFEKVRNGHPIEPQIVKKMGDMRYDENANRIKKRAEEFMQKRIDKTYDAEMNL